MEMERNLREWDHNWVKVVEDVSECRHLKQLSLPLYPFWESELLLFIWELLTLATYTSKLLCSICFCYLCFDAISFFGIRWVSA